MTHLWNPAEYEKHSSAQKKWGGALIDRLNPAGNETLLDIGCGDGALTIEIASRLPRGRAFGIDRSCEMIEYARARYPEQEYPNCSFECIDAQKISFGPVFDIVFSNAALHWVPGQDQVLRKVYDALKPGGRLLFQMGGYGNAAEFFAVAYELMDEDEWKDSFTGFTPGWRFCSADEYRELLKDAGFTPLRAELIQVDMVHENRSGLEGWIRTTWLPFLERLSDSGKEEFITTVSGRYLEKYPADSDGRTHVKMVRLETEAVKENR